MRNEKDATAMIKWALTSFSPSVAIFVFGLFFPNQLRLVHTV
jgi:hypothetical protein